MSVRDTADFVIFKRQIQERKYIMNQEKEKSNGGKEANGQVRLGMDEQELITMVKNLAGERDGLKKERDEQNQNLENLYAKLRDAEKQAADKDKMLQDNEEILKSRYSSSEKKIRRLKCISLLSVFLILIFICTLISKINDYNQLLDEKTKLRNQSEEMQAANEKLQESYEEVQVSLKNQQDINQALQKMYEELSEYEGLYGGCRKNFYASKSFVIIKKGESGGFSVSGVQYDSCEVEASSDAIKCSKSRLGLSAGSIKLQLRTIKGVYVKIETRSSGIYTVSVSDDSSNESLKVLVIVIE